jgi:vacuolar-type H+-ATPase subunit I/STV1
VNEPVHEMSRAIGKLEAIVKALTDTWQRQDDEATEGRRVLHSKMDELSRQQAALSVKVEQQTKQLAEIEPAIKRFEEQRQRQEGAASLFKILWMGVVAFATGLGYAGHELLTYLWPPKVH